MDGIDRAALRDVPAWDRWQDVRMPVTIDEANAAILLVNMKRDVLESAAAIDPEREPELQFAADRWAELLVKLEWAREVLRSGESVDARKYRHLRERHDALVRLASDCPDTRTLIDTLLLRIQRANKLLDEWRDERNIAAERYDEAKARHAERVEKLTATIAEKQAKIDAQDVKLHARGQEIATLQSRPAAVTGDQRASYARALHEAAASCVFVFNELVEGAGVTSPVAAHVARKMLNQLPAGFYETWIAEQLPWLVKEMERRAVTRGEETR